MLIANTEYGRLDCGSNFDAFQQIMQIALNTLIGSFVQTESRTEEPQQNCESLPVVEQIIIEHIFHTNSRGWFIYIAPCAVNSRALRRLFLRRTHRRRHAKFSV